MIDTKIQFVMDLPVSLLGHKWVILAWCRAVPIQGMTKPETGDTVPIARDNAFHVKYFVINIDTFLYTAEVDCIEFETMLRKLPCFRIVKP